MISSTFKHWRGRHFVPQRIKRLTVGAVLLTLLCLGVAAGISLPQARASSASPAGTVSIKGSMEGDLKIKPGDLLGGGYDFNGDAGASVTVSAAQVVLKGYCEPANTPYSITISMADYTTTSDGGWDPSGDQSYPGATWQGSYQTASTLCGGGSNIFEVNQGTGGGEAYFSASFSANVPQSLNVRFHYADHTQNGSGSWSGTASVVPSTTTTTTTTTAATTTTTSATTTQTTPAPGLSFKKLERIGPTGSFVPGPVTGTLGSIVFYEMLATNTGDTTLTVKLADPRCDAGTVSPAGAVVLAPGTTATFTCSHELVAGDGPRFVNTAVATAGSISKSSSVTAIVKSGAVKGKKVVKKAQPAHPVVKAASFTG